MLRKLAAVALFTAGIVAAAPAAAQAATTANCHRVHQQSTGNYGLLNGTQVYAPINLGLGLNGTALGLLGNATASSTDSSTTTVKCGN